MKILSHRVIALACLLPLAAVADEPSDATAVSPQIPFIAELTISGVVSESNGDHEPIYQVQSIGDDSYRMLFSAEVPQGFGNETVYVEVPRNVFLEDQQNARIMRPRFFTGDPESFSGTTPFFSAAVLNDLRRDGEAAFTWCSVETFFGMPVAKFYSGTLKRIETTKIPVLVNGRRVELAAMHAGGQLLDGNKILEADVYILDDPDNPLFLRSRSSRVIRIDFPVKDAPSESLENALAERRNVDVYGIYFAFNSASIRPQSERKLKEIAGILKKNPDWTLRIDGHTDNIGSDASNLELSRRRAEAVTSALVRQHGIAADRLAHGGYGEGSPKETNDTVEGRARNRRVELTRL